jgi:DNA polymerase III alpha subunit (gram-positive type)
MPEPVPAAPAPQDAPGAPAAPPEAPPAARPPGPPRLVFVDTEATGLDHRIHQLTEVAWILREPDGTEHVRRYVPEHTLEHAEEKALEITRYHELLAEAPRTPDAEWLDVLLADADGGVLVGVVPDFDARHLLQACQRAGRTPTWDHHLIDVGVLAMPLLADVPEVPRGVASLCASLGVPFDSGQAHGALYDAMQTMRCFDRVWELLGALRASGAPLPPPVPRPPSSRDPNGAAGPVGSAGQSPPEQVEGR